MNPTSQIPLRPRITPPSSAAASLCHVVDDTGVSRTHRHATFGDQPALFRRAGLTKPKVLFTAAIWKAADHTLEAFTLAERTHDLANAGWCDGTDRRFRRQPRYLAAV